MQGLGNLLGVSYFINFILIIVVVFFQRRDPIVSMAWVLCFILFPVGGMVIFLIFGLGMKRRTRAIYGEKQLQGEKMASRLYSQLDFLDMEAAKEVPDLDIVRYFCKYNCLYTEKNSVDIYTKAEDKYKQLLEDIENAQESINLLYFIIRNDVIGNRIMDALVKKANEGVRVRLLYDSIGSILTPRSFFKRLDKTKYGKAARFFPVNIFTLSKINHRNHRKIVVIDGKAAYLGGMNIGDEYMGRKKLTPWRDTHIRITGESVKLVYKCFCLDWDFSTRENLSSTLDEMFAAEQEASGDVPIQIVASGPDSPAEEIKCGMIKMLNSARHYAYIQTPYFVPDQTFINALVMAADSGVDVRLMLPGKPDKPYVYYTSFSYLDEMLKAGVKVYLHEGFIHSKTMVVDDKIATIGTTTIDMRSFQLHFELNAFFYSGKVATECRRIFEDDENHSREMTLEEYERRPRSKRMKEGFFRLFSPIM